MKDGDLAMGPKSAWKWPLSPSDYNRAADLTQKEREHIGRLVTRFAAGGRGWHKAARPALARLLLPLHDTLDHLGATVTETRNRTVRTTVICLLIRAMHRHNCSFWTFNHDQWIEILGSDYYAYVAQHGVTANARQQLIAVAFLLCGFDRLGALGRLAFHALAEKVFGADIVNPAISDMEADLRHWGYTEKGNITGLRAALALAMMTHRSPRIEDLRRETLVGLYNEATAKITRRGLVILSYALVRRGLISEALGREGQTLQAERLDHRRATDGVPAQWLQWCDRWFATSTLQPSSRTGTVYRLFQAGRWMARERPNVLGPADWDRETAAAFVAAVDRATIGGWSTPAGPIRDRIGEPFAPASKEAMLRSMRTFLADCHEWGWVTIRLQPAQALATPRAIRSLIGPDPRVIGDDVWAKLIWAGLNLDEGDVSQAFRPHSDGTRTFYPIALVRALAVVWLFTGLRRNEILRLPVGCIRWQVAPDEHSNGAGQKSSKICMLDVPVNKTGTAFTKPVDEVVGTLVNAWETVRPPQPRQVDKKTGKRVAFLFSYRGRPVGNNYINANLIPMLCKKAGVPAEDARGAITSHRARSTIATQLYNAKEPLSLTELQEWLGHRSPEATRHYAKISPTKLAKAYEGAGYFARNLRAVEVLIDQDAVRAGKANDEPWKHYDLGHGYCSYDFFDQCRHRMACAKCSFYVPKESSRAQLLEGKANLLRLRQEIPLSDDEIRAVDDGIDAHTALVAKLADVATPDGNLPDGHKPRGHDDDHVMVQTADRTQSSGHSN